MKILSGLLTPTIALIAVYIAWQQKKLANDKLKFDLYEKRFKIYKIVNEYIMNLISETAQGHDINSPKKDFTGWVNFNLATKETPFLFDKDITDYLAVIRDKAQLLLNVCNTLNDPICFPMYSQDRNDKLAEHRTLSNWFQDELHVVETPFESYLSFKHLK